MARENLSTQEIYGLMLLIVYSLIKSILHFVRIINPFKFKGETLEEFDKWDLIISDISNIIFILFSLHLIFIKNIKNTIYFIVCILLLFKGLLHFITDYKLYRYFDFNKDAQEKIKKFHDDFSTITDLSIGLVAFYFLMRIF